MSEIGYYPGCSLKGTAAEYDLSLRAVAGRLGVELREVPDWLCCGATSAHAIDREAALALAADTLAKAGRAGIEQILAPCAMCYQRLASAAHELSGDQDLRRRVDAAFAADGVGDSVAGGRSNTGNGKTGSGTTARGPGVGDAGYRGVAAVNLLRWLEGLGDEAIKAQVKRPLKGLKVACYYGCLLVRPAKVTGADEVEAPRNMEKLVGLLGAQTVRWSMAMECCGGSFALSRKSAVLRQVGRIYESARKAGADVICLACPMCQANLDMRQGEIGITPAGQLPVVYLTQLMGMAMGMESAAMRLEKHFVGVRPPVEAALARSKPAESTEARG